MARIMCVRNAARIHKFELKPLIAGLSKVAQDAARRQQ